MILKKTSMSLAAVLLIVGSGIVHGLITDRWTDVGRSVREAVARLRDVPGNFGNWELKEEYTIPERQRQVGEIDGYISRTYVNPVSGDAVSVIVVCGRPGPISVHTPDICFRGQGLEQVREQEHQTVATTASATAGQCWQADFVKRGASLSSGVRVYWTWSPDGEWTAPSNPRLTFAGNPVLYKMYVTRSLSAAPGAASQDDPVSRFLADWIPAVNRALFPDAATAEPHS